MVYNDLDAELAAMQQIASVLSRLDPAARTRALHWLQGRFQDGTAAAVAAAPAAIPVLKLVSPPEPPADESLSVATLNDFFEARPMTVKTPPSVTGLLHEFVAEFQDIAREWNVAAAS